MDYFKKFFAKGVVTVQRPLQYCGVRFEKRTHLLRLTLTTTQQECRRNVVAPIEQYRCNMQKASLCSLFRDVLATNGA